MPCSLWSPAACSNAAISIMKQWKYNAATKATLACTIGDRNHTLADNLPNLFISINNLLNVRELAYEHSLIPQWREDSYVVAVRTESITAWKFNHI